MAERKILPSLLFNKALPESQERKRTLTYSHHPPGGRDCFSFSAFSLSVMTRVYRYLLQRTLNFTLSLFFLIFTAVGQQGHVCGLRKTLKFCTKMKHWSNSSLIRIQEKFEQEKDDLHLASFLLAVSRKSLISSIFRGCSEKKQKNIRSAPRRENLRLWLGSKVMLGDRWN